MSKQFIFIAALDAGTKTFPREKAFIYIFCESLSHAKDCRVAVRSRAMSVQAARKRHLNFT